MVPGSVRRGLLGALVGVSGVLACRGGRTPMGGGQPTATACAGGSAGITQARLDSLGLRAREAGERGDLAVLHAVSDTLDSLERSAGPPCRPATAPAGP
ncbi:MAG TPA: hypothetical protein VFI39_05500 [Gemmatimonadales bacterium]|nr:hypothetical protein [Gemmatimonadales bacterium]